MAASPEKSSHIADWIEYESEREGRERLDPSMSGTLSLDSFLTTTRRSHNEQTRLIALRFLVDRNRLQKLNFHRERGVTEYFGSCMRVHWKWIVL